MYFLGNLTGSSQSGPTRPHFEMAKSGPVPAKFTPIRFRPEFLIRSHTDLKATAYILNTYLAAANVAE